MLQSTNFNQLKNELKQMQGKAMFKLTRTGSTNNGEFLRILHKVKANELEFWDGKQITYLPIKASNEVSFIPNGFKVNNCMFELISA